MLDKIKTYALAAVGVALAVMYAMFRIQKAEKETAVEQKEKFQSAAEESAQTVEVIKNVEESKAAATTASDNELDGMLSKYDRSRKD